ncbi:MAG: hypothetical protein M1820_001997 [Bogoriella megaspora]|nr:MAG: hypothetical protein M1820_001997 [Bogoriella megaspora]
MVPTLDPIGTLVFTSKRYRRGRGIQVGDLVSFDHPVKHGRGLKRVVGMPGDFVLRDTPGAGEPGHEMMIQVPKGHCYIAGDNLKYSRDSRMFGPLPLALIRGKVVAGLRFGADTGYIPEFQRYGGALKEVN